MMNRLGIVLAFAPILCGFCDGLSTDPREGGYLAGKCALQSGAYEHRLQQRRKELDSLDHAEQSLQSRLAAGHSERSALDRQIGALRQKIGEDKQAIRRLSAEIKRHGASSSSNAAELASIEAEKEQLQAELVRLSEEASAKEMAVRRMQDRPSDVELAGKDKGQTRTSLTSQ